jgi:glycyl-tRNA synthetase beta chain
VRPLHNICCTFDAKEVKIEVAGAPSEAATWGHRFHAPAKIPVTTFARWEAALRGAKVTPFREERKAYIFRAAQEACSARGFELVEDALLLEEVAGLAEWPQVIFGDMDKAFLDLPGEVIRLSMRTHQKYFAVREAQTKKLAPHFIAVANIEAKDGGKVIAAGNRRVLSARLNDARFFWETDKKTPLFTEARKAKLEKVVFHQKLGSVWDKVERVKALASRLSSATGAEPKLVERAALLSKMDLVTETVQEFPELQGQIGRELASLHEPAGKNGSIALAIEDHYRPLGPNDRAPTDKIALTLALADKLDTLTGFWVIDEKPTGSSDPYALRRAALGIVRIILENGVRIGLVRVAAEHAEAAFGASRSAAEDLARSLVAFLADRLKVQLRDQGKRHDLVDAVFALGDDDLARILARVDALGAFLKTEDGSNLLAGYKRAANILAAEEQKGAGLSAADRAAGLDPALLHEPAEKALDAALAGAIPKAQAGAAREDFAGAMLALAGLRRPVDAFFEGVLVNAEDASLRRNRLLLLSRLREALSAVADFSKIEG